MEELPPSLAKGTGEQGITETIPGSVDKQEQGKQCAEWLRQFILGKGDRSSLGYTWHWLKPHPFLKEIFGLKVWQVAAVRALDLKNQIMFTCNSLWIWNYTVSEWLRMRAGSSADGAVPSHLPVNDNASALPDHPTAPKSSRQGTACGGAFLEVGKLNSSCPKDSADGPVNSGAWVSLLVLWDCA